jgi:hypothetical protein
MQSFIAVKQVVLTESLGFKRIFHSAIYEPTAVVYSYSE